jgi:phosphoribosylaminoimidazolecarboxamide formyltransferase/IMP cyclohydrolase
MDVHPIRRAIISTSDKLGLIGFAQGLSQAGVELFSTGGTRRYLEQADIAVRDVAAYTGFPEMMDGRVKTLHPKIFGGILARRDVAADRTAMQQNGILPFDLVVVNLYPFAATARRPEANETEIIEQIDIGGPSLVRAAAKNSPWVTVATSPAQYGAILDQVQRLGGTGAGLRRRLMIAAFQHTAAYDCAIADHFARAGTEEPLPDEIQLRLRRKSRLRYGENSHQAAGLYSTDGPATADVTHARQLHGKELSYNNILDADAALAIVRGFESAACCVIKHNNPCGAAIDDRLATACERAFAADPVSAFGSVLGFNRELDASTAEFLAHDDRFVEAIVAPGFSPAAFEILTTRPKWKKNVRLLDVGQLGPEPPALEFRSVTGGILIQESDREFERLSRGQVVTQGAITDQLIGELEFGWNVVRHVKSNAITLSRNRALCGVGAGQMSRVDSVDLAIRKAGPRARGAVLASDAFFPFADSIHLAAQAGIAAIVQPGGSVRDDEVLAACNQHGIPMLVTGRRHFRH